MTEWLLALVPQYGLWLIAVTTLCSCLALPFLAAGGFAAVGDLVLWQVVLAAVSGAVVGDQIGYAAGRSGGAGLVDRLAASPTRGVVIEKARGVMAARGGPAVFLTRWLFSPLGPYVNVLSGAMRHSWTRFTLWGIAGELVWCGLYVMMGRSFAGNLEAASSMLTSILGFVAAGTAMLGLGWWLIALARREKSTQP